MGKKLYVGNLSYSVSSSDLEGLFAPFGTVQSAQVIQDRDTGRSKGFGFVEMPNDTEAKEAIEGLNDISLGRKTLVVKQAEDKQGGGGGGYRGGNSSYNKFGNNRPPRNRY